MNNNPETLDQPKLNEDNLEKLFETIDEQLECAGALPDIDEADEHVVLEYLRSHEASVIEAGLAEDDPYLETLEDFIDQLTQASEVAEEPPEDEAIAISVQRFITGDKPWNFSDETNPTLVMQGFDTFCTQRMIDPTNFESYSESLVSIDEKARMSFIINWTARVIEDSYNFDDEDHAHFSDLDDEYTHEAGFAESFKTETGAFPEENPFEKEYSDYVAHEFNLIGQGDDANWNQLEAPEEG